MGSIILQSGVPGLILAPLTLWVFSHYGGGEERHREVIHCGGAMRPIPLSETYLAIVCPMANEGNDAVRFVQAVMDRCPGVGRVRFFVVVDNATTDNSVELLREYAASNDERLVVVWAPENRNVVDAYVRGYREAVNSGADWILEIDAGFSHQPDDIPQFLERIEQDYDCIFGSRFMAGAQYVRGSYKRYFISRAGSLLTNTLLGTRLSDMTSGFELFSRPALEQVLRIGVHSRAHFIQTEIKVYCRGLRYVEVPIRYQSPSPRLGSAALGDSLAQLWRLLCLRCRGELPLIARPAAATH